MKASAVCIQFAGGLSAGLGAAAAGAWLTWPSSAIDYIKTNTGVTPLEISILVALMDFGNILSPIPSGYLMNKIGRKMTLYLAGIIGLISWAFTFFGKNVWWLYVARILAGIEKGIAFAVTPVYLGEISDRKLRGALSTCFIGLLNVGLIFDYVVGPFVSYEVLNGLNLIIPCLFLLTFWVFPESPYFLIMKGKENRARKAFGFFRCIKKDEDSDELAAELALTKETVEKDLLNKGRFVDVFIGHNNRRALIIICFLAIFQRLSGISPTLAYSTQILPEPKGAISKHMYMIIFAILLASANFAAIALVDTWGRKPLLILSASTSAAVMLLAMIFYILESTMTSVDCCVWMPYTAMLVFAITYSIGIGFLPSSMVAELFPTNVRSHAGAISAILLAATSFSVNMVFLLVKNDLGVYYMYAVFVLSCTACTLFVIFYVFETKGKTFQDIQDILTEKK